MKTRLWLAATLKAVALVLVLSGCMNRKLPAASSSTAQNNLLNILGNAANYPIYVTQVVKTTLPDTTPIFELLGDGDGAIGSKCGISSATATPATGTTPSPAASQCVCSYTYVVSGGSKQTLEMASLYTESNLMRCSYVGLPANVSTVTVQIRILAGAGGVSNPTDYSFVGSKGPGDPSNIANFARVRRYQCKKLLGPHEGVSYAFDSTFYDPLEAEDPHNADVLNFYTTNMGSTLTAFAAGPALFGGQTTTGQTRPYDWYCPPNPIDDSTGAATDTVNQMDMRLYSVNPLGGSTQIYPPVPGNDRYTFYLATQPTGIFNVPVDAYITPKTPTSYVPGGNGTGIPPIGYGAAPVLVNVPGQSIPDETCPDVSTSPIPDGYKWVKVWLFRTTTPQKTIPVSQTFGHTITAIGCNPGKWNEPVTNPAWIQNIVEGCYSPNGAPGMTPYSIDDLSQGKIGAGTLLGRFLFYGQNPSACFMNDPSQGASVGGNGAFPGADVWVRNIANDTNRYPQFGCAPSPYGDPLTTCGNLGGNSSVLKDSSLIAQAIPSGDANGSNYDFLFVVSAPSVTLNMMNQWGTLSEYTPFRFAAPSDCGLGADPNTCIANLRASNQLNYLITNYGLKLHAVNQLDNPGGDDPTRVGAFPVCAIQPK